MLTINDLKFDDKGLIPAIVTDCETGEVLTLAYMNQESLRISMEEKMTCFWSRSRKELWRKGATSGNRQHITKIIADCDRDALTVFVRKDGPACHLGNPSCFVDELFINEEEAEALQNREGTESFQLEDLYSLLKDRKAQMPEGSYTTYLFQKGLDKILKKVGEESTEVIIAGKAEDKAETIYEIADLTYHVMVLMVEMGISLDEVQAELASRHVIDHKVKQEKMGGEVR